MEILAGARPCGPWFNEVLAQSLKVRSTDDGRGDGLFTTAAIAAGVHVAIYGGRLQSDARHTLRLAGCDWYVNGADARLLPLTHAAAMTNSSSRPNCRLVYRHPCDWPRERRNVLPGVPVLVTTHAVAENEELVWRYSLTCPSHARVVRDDRDASEELEETLFRAMQLDKNWTREQIAGLRATHALSPELVRFRGKAWLRIGPSRVCSGRGVFAEREFETGDLILVYDGETCSAERGRESQHVAKLRGGCVDGNASVGGMLNTSARPNAELRSSGGVWARCAISRGEEIVIPYGRGFRAVHM